jgi:hypothetical protein
MAGASAMFCGVFSSAAGNVGVVDGEAWGVSAGTGALGGLAVRFFAGLPRSEREAIIGAIRAASRGVTGTGEIIGHTSKSASDPAHHDLP